jgi:hypothetical protein
VDYLISVDGKVIPVEVKAGKVVDLLAKAAPR